MSAIGRVAKRMVRSLGYDLRRRSAQYACHLHPFPDQRAIFSRRPPGVILDVGANIGQSVARYRWLFPDATIHSFEPVPEAFEQLRRSAAGDERVHVWQLAVGDASGVVRFHSNRMSDTSSLLATQPDKADDAYLGTKVVLEVPSKTLDEFCAEQAIPSASILKLDVQGGEGLVLAGANGLLARQAVDLILTEVWFDAPYVGAPHFCEIDAVLRAAGYQLYGMYFGPHQYENIPIFTADAIYLNAETVAQLDRECRAVSRGLAGEYTALFGE
jgi:FkbM family methyltransferase